MLYEIYPRNIDRSIIDDKNVKLLIAYISLFTDKCLMIFDYDNDRIVFTNRRNSNDNDDERFWMMCLPIGYRQYITQLFQIN